MNAPVLRGAKANVPTEGRYFNLRFGIPDQEKVFVYVGLLVPGRGIEALIETFQDDGVPAHLVLLGYRDTLGLRHRCSGNPRVHLHPAVPHDEVVPLLRHADVGVCLVQDVSLSDRLCLPNKLFEYAFAGLAVLASDLPEIKRVVHKFSLGICCVPSSHGIRHGDLEALNLKVRAGGADLAELSWEHQASVLLAHYRRLLGKSTLPTARSS